MVKFDRRPQLDALIRELTKAFAVHYEEPPSAKQISQLQRLRDKGLTDNDLGNDSVLNHTKWVASLKSPDWLVDTFRCHLNASSWPPSDKAQGQPIGSGSCRKQVRDQGKLELRIPQAKSQRVSDGSRLDRGSRTALNDERSD